MSDIICKFFFSEQGQNPQPKARFSLVEVPDADWDDVSDMVRDDEWIEGDLLVNGPGEERNSRVIHFRRPVLFRGSAVERVQVPGWKFVESAK
jgi:hypothetical protein